MREKEREREREEGCVLVMEGCGGRRRGGWREVRGGSCFLLFSFYLMTTVVADDAFLFSYDFYGTFFFNVFFFSRDFRVLCFESECCVVL